MQVFPRVKAYVLKNSGTEDDALDIFQESMVVLCRQVQSSKFDASYEVAGFVFTVCRNLWINKTKKDKRHVTFETKHEKTDDYDFTDDIMTKQKEKVLKDIADKLGEKCFKLLQYSIFHDMKSDEIVERMGFATVNAVKTQKYKCKQKLYTLLNENKNYREVLE